MILPESQTAPVPSDWDFGTNAAGFTAAPFHPRPGGDPAPLRAAPVPAAPPQFKSRERLPGFTSPGNVPSLGLRRARRNPRSQHRYRQELRRERRQHLPTAHDRPERSPAHERDGQERRPKQAPGDVALPGRLRFSVQRPGKPPESEPDSCPNARGQQQAEGNCSGDALGHGRRHVSRGLRGWLANTATASALGRRSTSAGRTGPQPGLKFGGGTAVWRVGMRFFWQ